MLSAGPGPSSAGEDESSSPDPPPADRGRVALVWVIVALALSLAPLRAVVVEAGRWTPQGDDALLSLRALDVGTGRTPLVGQPSTSGEYGQATAHVAHPGPAGIYLLTPGMRTLGAPLGILLATAGLAVAAAVASAAGLARVGGRAVGLWGAVVVALAMWTAGGAGLVDPLSSNLGRMPLIAATLLVWVVACGGLRWAPLAVAFWSFAAQQHLSVLPAAAVLGLAGAAALGGIGLRRWRAGDRAGLGEWGRWLGASAAVGLVLWAPVLIEQAQGDPGNLRAMASFAGDGERVDLGYRSGVSQVLRVLGGPPFVGRSGVTGWDLVEPVGVGALLSGLTAIAVLAGGAWWARRRAPQLTWLIGVAAVVAVGGVLTGANVPDSPEQGRISFFHWAFALSVLEVVALGWLAGLVVVALRARRPGSSAGSVRPSSGVRPVVVLGVAALVVIVALAILPVGLDRGVDRLAQPLDAAVVDDVVGAVLADPSALGADAPLLTLVAGDDRFVQIGDTVRVRLRAEGRDVRFDPAATGFVHDDHRLDPCRADGALVIGVGLGDPVDGVPAPPFATIPGVPGLDLDAFASLSDEARGTEVVLGADLEAALGRLPDAQADLVEAGLRIRLPDRPGAVLRTRSTVELLLAHPPVAPRLDAEDLQALLASFPADAGSVAATHITVHRLDREQLAAFRPDLLAGCP